MSKKSKNLLRIYNRLKRGPVNIEVIKQWAKSYAEACVRFVLSEAWMAAGEDGFVLILGDDSTGRFAL